MYEAFYRLRERPFSILPDPDFIYWGRSHRVAFTMLEFGVMHSAGITVITGEVGSGKTTLVRYLLRRLDPQTTVGLVSNTPQGRDELLQCIMMSVGQAFDQPYVALLQRFNDFLHAQHAAGRRTVLIIDEAQNLRADALEGLRMLSNVNTDKTQILGLVLVGQVQLKSTLRDPQFVQRVSSDVHLKPLERDEVAHYIHHRLTAAGSTTQLFSADACRMIAEVSRGVPRVINLFCDTALVYGFAARAAEITSELVKEVIQDKQTYGIFPANDRMDEDRLHRDQLDNEWRVGQAGARNP